MFAPLLFAGRETAVLEHPPPLLHLRQQGAEGALRTPLTRPTSHSCCPTPSFYAVTLVDIKLPTYGTREEQQFVVSRRRRPDM
jgi:hypothetical protein